MARSRGRPSLSKTGESPVLRVRISWDLDRAIGRAVRRERQTNPSLTVSDWLRAVLVEATQEPSDDE